jgi:tRNA modification GTPase
MKRGSPEHHLSSPDTIAAAATAVGGAIAVIRISGPAASAAADQTWKGALPISTAPPRQLHAGRIVDQDNAVIDHVMAVRFQEPASYTGEDMVEIHCHGGVLGARAVLQRVLAHPAVRHAEPGEFTKRAFLNGKMDLTQSEAVADIIEAHTEMALRVANRQLAGALGRQINTLYDELLLLLSELESRLDFPDEELDWMTPQTVTSRLHAAEQTVARLIASRQEGDILRNGIRLVIAGSPNVGKSSLLNAILGRDRAIVTDIPGTTRDTLEELAHIRGIPIRLIDTAGIREVEDLIEKCGVERSLASIRQAQVLLWVFDATAPMDCLLPSELSADIPLILVGNKADKLQHNPPEISGNLPKPIYTSALAGTGFDRLYDEIERAVWENPHVDEPQVAVSIRHAQLLDETQEGLKETVNQLQTECWELAAAALGSALQSLGRVTGRTAAPDILDTIFSRFCIGK